MTVSHDDLALHPCPASLSGRAGVAAAVHVRIAVHDHAASFWALYLLSGAPAAGIRGVVRRRGESLVEAIATPAPSRRACRRGT